MNTLKSIIDKEQMESAKNLDIEIQEFLGDLLDKVLEENNIKFKNNEVDEIINNLKSKINYQEATDEDIKVFFEALIKIIK